MFLDDVDSRYTLLRSTCITQPATSTANKWTMISKKAVGKCISNWHNIIAALFSSSSNFTGSRTLLHMALKKNHSQVTVNLTLLGKISRMATANKCIKTWQSWDFNPTNLRSFNYIRLLIFEEHPCGTLTRRRHWQKLIFSFLDKVWQARGNYIFLPSDLRCNFNRIPILARSWRVFKPSFVLPWMLRSIPLSLTVGVITCSPLEPLRPTLSSCRYSRSPIGLAFSMYSEQN